MRGEPTEESSDGIPESFAVPGGGLADQRLQFGEGLLNRIEIGAVGRQVDKPGAARLDGFAHASHLVRAEVVHDDDVTGHEGRGQDLFDVGEEHLAVHRAIKDERCRYPGRSQSGDECRCLPVPVRNGCNKTLTTLAAPAQPGHVRGGPGLVEANELVRIQARLTLAPSLARRRDVRPALFGGM